MKYIIQITKGVIRDQSTRRTAMFVIIIAAMVMLFAGIVFLNRWLMQSPVWFILYWIACAWLTLTAVLLALYDLVALRIQMQRERRHLKEEIFNRGDDKEE